MIDLIKPSGLPIHWDSAKERIVCGENMEPADCQPAVRCRIDMQGILYDPEAKELNELYYMYRGLSLADDSSSIKAAGLRYDITAIRPGTISGEFVKTVGHYHPEKTGTGFTWPEVYEVLFGRAHYLLQRHRPDRPDQLESVFLITARPGDKVLIPPGFGHITTNPGDDFLIMSNWVAEGFSSLYEPIKQMKGGAYFELKINEVSEFIPNSHYPQLPLLKRCPVTPVEEFKLITGLPLYSVFKENNEVFRFLTHPEEYTEVFNNYLRVLTSS